MQVDSVLFVLPISQISTIKFNLNVRIVISDNKCDN